MTGPTVRTTRSADGPGPPAGTRLANGQRAEFVDRLRHGGVGALYDCVRDAASTAGPGTVVLEGRSHLTGWALVDRLASAAHRFSYAGVERDDVVLFAVRPGIDGLIALLALLRLGAVVTWVTPGTGPELFERRLSLLRPRWVVAESVLYLASTPGPLRGILRARGLELPDIGGVDARHIALGRRLPGLPRGAVRWRWPGGGSRPASRWNGPPDGGVVELPPPPDPSDPAIVIFTSGTTGDPKGVQHSGRSAATAISIILEHLDVSADKGRGAVVHTQAINSTVAAIMAGATTRITPLRTRPRGWLRQAERDGVTTAFLRPADAFRITEFCRARGHRLPASLRTAYLYSAPVTHTLLERLHALAAPEFTAFTVYGMTEAVPVAWADSHRRLAWDAAGDLVGPPASGVEVRIGPEGTLQVRGPNVHLGYLGGAPVEWHDSGDHARLEPDGSIVLLGRAKDMILRDSFNIYPGLYEETIGRVPGVLECAMVGVPHPESGDERVVLFVAPDGSAEGRDPVALERRLERALRKGPLRIDLEAIPDEVVVVGALPRSERTRKIDRAALRRTAGAPALPGPT